MNTVVFMQSIRQARRTILILTVAALSFFYLVMLSSSSFITKGNTAFFRNPPKAIGALLGGSVDFFSPRGWLSSAMSHPITLALFIAAGLVVAGGAVAAEVERGTIDLVLSRPVGRVPYLIGKGVAALACVTVVEAGGFVGVLVARLTVKHVNELAVTDVARTFLGSWLLFVGFAMIALLISARMSLRSRANGLTIGIIVAWYFVNFIALLFDATAGIRFASPFHYFRAADVVSGRPIALDMSVLVAIAVAACAAAVWLFKRRDLTH
jgi:ABC-2 type transport system permease protein